MPEAGNANQTKELLYGNRRAVQVENDSIRLTVTVEGGYVAEVLHKPMASIRFGRLPGPPSLSGIKPISNDRLTT
jgi:hypothetical protein